MAHFHGQTWHDDLRQVRPAGLRTTLPNVPEEEALGPLAPRAAAAATGAAPPAAGAAAGAGRQAVVEPHALTPGVLARAPGSAPEAQAPGVASRAITWEEQSQASSELSQGSWRELTDLVVQEALARDHDPEIESLGEAEARIYRAAAVLSVRGQAPQSAVVKEQLLRARLLHKYLIVAETERAEVLRRDLEQALDEASPGEDTASTIQLLYSLLQGMGSSLTGASTSEP